MILSCNVTAAPRVLMIPQASCMWSRYIYKQIKYKGTLLWKLHLSCKLHFFKAAHCIDQPLPEHMNQASSKPQHKMQHNITVVTAWWDALFSQAITRNSEKCFAEDNWVENYGLMKHMHLTAVKFQPVSALLSNSINLFPMTIRTNLQLWE